MDQMAEGMRSPEKPIVKNWISFVPILFPILLAIFKICEGLRLCFS